MSTRPAIAGPPCDYAGICGEVINDTGRAMYLASFSRRAALPCLLRESQTALHQEMVAAASGRRRRSRVFPRCRTPADVRTTRSRAQPQPPNTPAPQRGQTKRPAARSASTAARSSATISTTSSNGVTAPSPLTASRFRRGGLKRQDHQHPVAPAAERHPASPPSVTPACLPVTTERVAQHPPATTNPATAARAATAPAPTRPPTTPINASARPTSARDRRRNDPPSDRTAARAAIRPKREHQQRSNVKTSGWRDPDSNRGHHDFQTDARGARTATKCLQMSGYPGTRPAPGRRIGRK